MQAGHGKAKYTSDDVAVVKSLYVAHCSFIQIERLTGIDDQAVRRILVREGFINSSRVIRPTYPDHVRREAIRLYVDERMSAKSVGLSVSVPVFTVKAWVKEAGVVRSQSEAAALAISRGHKRGRSRVHIPWHSTKTGQWHMADSTYEAVRMGQLDANPDVLNWGLCKHRIPYFHPFQKTHRSYIPDLEIQYANGTFCVEEIKPSNFVTDPVNEAKFAAASAYFGGLGIRFAVVTEEQIGADEIKQFKREGYASLSGVDLKQHEKKMRVAARARRLAKETPEEREARLKKDAEKSRAYRAAKKRDKASP